MRRRRWRLRGAAWALALASSACARTTVEHTPSARPSNEGAVVAPQEEGVTSAQEVTTEEDRGPRPPATIYRSEVERALARGPGYLLYELGPEPYRLSGRFVGWEITRVFPDEPELCAQGCDLIPGDIILSVNGDRLETPQAFSNLVEAMPGIDELVVKLIRDEQRRTTTYAIVE